MQFTTIAATAILAATGLAAPSSANHGVEMAYFTFQGAADAQFPLEVPVDNQFKEIREFALPHGRGDPPFPVLTRGPRP